MTPKTLELSAHALAERLGCDGWLYARPGPLVNQTTIAAYLGITPRAVRDLVELGLPTVERAAGARHSVNHCVTWHRAYRLRVASPGYRRAPLSLADARRELQFAEWRSAPDAYVIVPVEFMEALASARILIDARVLARLGVSR